MNKDTLKTILLFLILILLILNTFVLKIYHNILIEPYQEFWQFLWVIIPLIFVIILIIKNKIKIPYSESILGGVIGGIIAGFILALRSSGEYQAIIGFLFTIIIIILFWYSRKRE